MIPPIIVNESSSISDAGDVEVFATVAYLESYLEPWYIDEPHFIFDSAGMQLEIIPSGNSVRLMPKHPTVFNPDLARLYLTNFLKAIAIAKGWDYVGVAEQFLQTATLPELVAASARFALK